ncbi:MAG: transcriptional regulator NrdR [Bacteriovoracia bacterium]
MKCPFCSAVETKVIDSRLNQTNDITRRRRECIHCEGRFTTYERVEEVMPVIIKKDGRREVYNRDKIHGGVYKACQKRPVGAQQIDGIVQSIEKKLQSFGAKEIPSKTIGQMVMAALHSLDKVAYVRFASVYREFQDVEEFVAELQELPNEPVDPASLAFPFVGQGENNPTATS